MVVIHPPLGITVGCYRYVAELWGKRIAPRLGALFADLDGGRAVRPSVLHGDLWSGNIASVEGAPSIYDPACYYGHHEAECVSPPNERALLVRRRQRRRRRRRDVVVVALASLRRSTRARDGERGREGGGGGGAQGAGGRGRRRGGARRPARGISLWVRRKPKQTPPPPPPSPA